VFAKRKKIPLLALRKFVRLSNKDRKIMSKTLKRNIRKISKDTVSKSTKAKGKGVPLSYSNFFHL